MTMPPNPSLAELLDLSLTARPAEDRFVVSGGFLYWFGKASVIALRGLPTPAAWRRQRGSNSWKPYWPRRFRMRMFEGDSVFLDFLGTGPAPQHLLDLISKFSSRHWNLLLLAARYNTVIPLIESAPALAFALASHWVFRRASVDRSPEALQKVVAAKRREIAGWLGFPAVESTVNMLRKIEPEALSVPALLSLRRILRHGSIVPRVFRHQRSIDNLTLMLLRHESLRGMVDESCLAAFARDDYNRSWRYAFNLLRAIRALAAFTRTTVRPLRSLEQGVRTLRQLYLRTEKLDWETERLVLQLLVGQIEYNEPQEYPAPPFPGAIGIEPISTLRDLYRESCVQANCVAERGCDVVLGDCYYYRMTVPVRATIELRRGPNPANWEITAVKAYGNTDIAPETREIVRRWLAAAVAARSNEAPPP